MAKRKKSGHRPIKVLEGFLKRKREEVASLAKLIKRRGGRA